MVTELFSGSARGTICNAKFPTDKRNFLSKFLKTILLFGGEDCSEVCCDMDQSDTIGKIELIPLSVLSADNANSNNNIHKFLQQFV